MANLGSPNRPPKVNTIHPAATGLLISAIARGGGFVVNGGSVYPGGKTTTQTGAPTAAVLGNIGACVEFTGSTDLCQFGSFPTTNFVPATIAAIFVVNASLANNQFICLSSAATTGGFGLGITASTLAPLIVQGGGVSAPSLGGLSAFSVGVPYFYACSWKSSGPMAISAVVVNLQNGKIFFSTTGSVAGSTIAGSGVFNIGNQSAGTRQLDGYVSAVAMSQVALSAAQLAAWASDPWSFWFSPSATFSNSSIAQFLGRAGSIIKTAAGTATGTATVSGVGASTAASRATASGSASVSGVGASTARAKATAAGVGSASAIGAGIFNAVGSSLGKAIVSGFGVGIQTVSAVGSAFGRSVVNGRTPSILDIVDTQDINLPINCILAGQQDYEVGPTEIEASDPAIKTRIMVSQGGGGKLSAVDSTFRVRTDSKGYD